MNASTVALLGEYATQMLVGGVEALIFGFFYRRHAQPYLLYWTIAFMAAAAYSTFAGASLMLALAGPTSADWRTLTSWLSQVAAYVEVTALLVGAMRVDGEAPSNGQAKRWMLGAALFATAVVASDLWISDGATSRLLLRVGLRFALCGAAFLCAAWILRARAASNRNSFSQVLVWATFAAYGCILLMEATLFIVQVLTDQPMSALQWLGNLDIAAQVSIGFGFVLWMSEEERERADAIGREYERTRQFDATTGLISRERALNLLDARLQEGSARCAVICFDLKGFEAQLNSFGLQQRDQAMVEAAHRTRSFFDEPSWHVARVFPSHFVAFGMHSGESAELSTLTHRALAVLSNPYSVDDTVVRPALVAGIAVGPTDGVDASTLLRNAEIACQGARGSVGFHSPERSRVARERMSLSEDVHQAIDKKEIVPFFQPIVDASTQAVKGYEALARWRHPKLGLLPPASFLSLFEELSLAAELDASIMLQAAHWTMQQSNSSLHISVNASAFTFADPLFDQRICDVLARTSLDPRRLQIEITESTALADISHTRRALNALRSRGIRVALDDFGIGYSSLAQLRDLPIDVLKLDRTFTVAVHDDKARAIVEVVVRLAQALRMDVVAEGVETADEGALFRDLGVSHLQGFWYGEPRETASFRAAASTMQA